MIAMRKMKRNTIAPATSAIALLKASWMVNAYVIAEAVHPDSTLLLGEKLIYYSE